jgi:hypothetical protein
MVPIFYYRLTTLLYFRFYKLFCGNNALKQKSVPLIYCVLYKPTYTSIEFRKTEGDTAYEISGSHDDEDKCDSFLGYSAL